MGGAGWGGVKWLEKSYIKPSQLSTKLKLRLKLKLSLAKEPQYNWVATSS